LVNNFNPAQISHQKDVAQFSNCLPETYSINIMEQTIYESRAKTIMADIRALMEAKGVNLDASAEQTGFSREKMEKILSGKIIPTLSEFLALCQISGIEFKLPFVETPNTAM
jgi:DNA-binding phage protein